MSCFRLFVTFLIEKNADVPDTNGDRISVSGDMCVYYTVNAQVYVVLTARLIHRVSKKLCQYYFLNNFVKHWPTLIIFGTQNDKDT